MVKKEASRAASRGRLRDRRRLRPRSRPPQPLRWETQAGLYAEQVRLYLVRHADAAPGEPDELRPLTLRGRQQARELGARLAAEGAGGAAVVTSPLLRARETAEEIARALGSSVQPDDRLAPGATADDVRAAVSERGEQVVAVGHQPDCSRAAAQLTRGPEPPFPKAGMVPIDLPGL
jgi:phosphohistidine phosphatase